MATGTVRLNRVVNATPEKIYRAFLEPDALAKWLPPHGFTGRVHHLEPRVGGTDRFDDPNLPGEMRTTITLRKVICATELNVVQEGIPEAIPPEMCYLGWQESLTLLARLVEAGVPG